jgi:hypothetical protein
VTNLPDAGVDLPELANEGTAADLMAGKELIDDEGNKVTGTFTIDSELSTQDNLISQIQAALVGKAVGGESGGSSGGSTLETCTVTISPHGPALPGMPSTGKLYYIDSTGALIITSSYSTISAVKNSIMLIYQSGDGCGVSGQATIVLNLGTTYLVAVHVTGDCSISM